MQLPPASSVMTPERPRAGRGRGEDRKGAGCPLSSGLWRPRVVQGALKVPVLKLDWLNWERPGLGGRKEKAFRARRDFPAWSIREGFLEEVGFCLGVKR